MTTPSQFANVPLYDGRELANVGTSEEVLASVTLYPNFFRTYGDAARITGAFEYAANANLKTVKMYFGASTSTVNGRVATDNNNSIIITSLIINKNGTFRSLSNLFAGITGFVINKINSYSDDPNSPILVRLTGQGVAAGDITARGLKVEYVPAGSVVPSI